MIEIVHRLCNELISLAYIQSASKLFNLSFNRLLLAVTYRATITLSAKCAYFHISSRSDFHSPGMRIIAACRDATLFTYTRTRKRQHLLTHTAVSARFTRGNESRWGSYPSIGDSSARVIPYISLFLPNPRRLSLSNARERAENVVFRAQANIPLFVSNSYVLNILLTSSSDFRAIRENTILTYARFRYTYFFRLNKSSKKFTMRNYTR